jgi:flagellar hook-associated protein 2
MASNLLTVDGVNTFVSDWTASETKKKVDPLTAKKKNYDDLTAAYTSLADKLSTLKGSAYALQQTGNSSAFLVKKTTSSNTTFVDLTATSASVLSSQSIRVNQLAKSDIAISNDLNSNAASTAITTTGTHTFDITAGDGKGGVLTSHVSVTFDASDFTAGTITNKAVIQKIQDALNANKAVAQSNSVSGSTTSAGSFKVNLSGTETVINYSAGTYSDVLDSIVSQINTKISGVNAEKVIDGSNYTLKVTVTDSSKYISINSDTSNLLNELNLSANQIMGSSGLVNASIFSPTSDLSQLSMATSKSGKDYKILSLNDTNGGQALSLLGLNLGSTRQAFVQNESGSDTSGFVYTTDQLNAKFLFNGIKVERSSNSISDLIPGATVSLKSLMQDTDTTVNLSISSDASKVMDKIQTFIKNFNDVYLFLHEKTKSTKEGRGLLIGNSIATTLRDLFSSEANLTIPGISTTELNSLSKIGITFSTSDGLTVSNSSQLEKAINEKPSQVEAVFNSSNGIAKTIYDRVTPYVNATGYLYTAKQNLDINTTYVNDKITAATDRINKNAADLRLRYMKIMTQTNSILQAQSSFIMSGSSTYLG